MSAIEDRGRIVAVLRGHIDADSAYVEDDYPYGRSLRCKRRYWIEVATKGQMRGKFRLVTQTTNPRRPQEVWNKPHPCQYAMRVFLVQFENNHVDKFSIYDQWVNPEEWMNILNRGLWDQLDLLERKELALIISLNRKRSLDTWARWEADIDDIRAAGAPDFAQWSTEHPDRIRQQAAYDARRTYVRMSGPDPSEPDWWESCWHGLCVASCDGTHHVDATGHDWTQPRPGLADEDPA